MVYQLPCLYFIFQRVDEILLGQRFIFREVDLLDQILFLYHFAGNDFVRFGIYCQVCFREAALSQFFIFDGVATVDNFEGVAFLHGFFDFLGLAFHI